ncbi:PucR family transcriptional regulator [Deinococcus sp. UYEF24]
MLLSDLLHHFPELALTHDDPARLTVHRIDALHGASAPIDGTLYLHADATEAARIVNDWQGQYQLRGLAILTAQGNDPAPTPEREAPGEVVWVEYTVSGPLPIDLSARLLRVLFESQPRNIGEDEQLQDELVEELLTRPATYALETLRRAHQAALDLSRFDVVVLIGGRSYDQGVAVPGSLPTKQALVRETRRAAADFTPGIGVFRVGTHVVALLDSRRHETENFAARLAVYLHSVFPTSYVLAAVGHTVNQATDLGGSYREARAALEVTLDTVRQERWVHYDDVRHLLFYREIRRNPELTALIEGSLRPLLDLPGEYRKVLLETLVAYLEHNRSPHRAAVALGVHPNTLKYRMKRIAEFIDLNTLSGGNYVLYFLAAKLNT